MSTYSDLVLSYTPNAYWRAGEASGNLADSSGNANTMTLNGAATYAQAGAISGDANTAVALNGNTANYFEAPNSASLNVADVFSVTAWVKMTSLGANNRLITQALNGYDFAVDIGGKIQLNKDGAANIADTGSNVITTGTYFMITATKNAADFHVYINAVDRTVTIGNATCTGPGGVTRIGQNVTGGGSPFNGTFDEIALFNYALSPAQILNLYSVGSTGISSVAADRRRRGRGRARRER